MRLEQGTSQALSKGLPHLAVDSVEGDTYLTPSACLCLGMNNACMNNTIRMVESCFGVLTTFQPPTGYRVNHHATWGMGGGHKESVWGYQHSLISIIWLSVWLLQSLAEEVSEHAFPLKRLTSCVLTLRKRN